MQGFRRALATAFIATSTTATLKTQKTNQPDEKLKPRAAFSTTTFAKDAQNNSNQNSVPPTAAISNPAPNAQSSAPSVSAPSVPQPPSPKREKLNKHESRFLKFSSIHVTNNPKNQDDVLMTPLDFLDSVTLEEPDAIKLSIKEYTEKYSKQEFTHRLNSIQKYYYKYKRYSQIFGRVGNYGLLTYSDYLFLQTLLSKNERTYHLAFRLLDEDGNLELDIDEYSDLEKFISGGEEAASKKPIDSDPHSCNIEISTGNHSPPSLIKYLFFGQEATKTVSINRFQNFSRSLQIEILAREFEFLKSGSIYTDKEWEETSEEEFYEEATFNTERQFSKSGEISKHHHGSFLKDTGAGHGHKGHFSPDDKTNSSKNKCIDNMNKQTIKASKFAHYILQQTRLLSEEKELRVEHISEKYPDTEIDFEQFLDFSEFLTNINDFGEVLRFMERNPDGPECCEMVFGAIWGKLFICFETLT